MEQGIVDMYYKTISLVDMYYMTRSLVDMYYMTRSLVDMYYMTRSLKLTKYNVHYYKILWAKSNQMAYHWDIQIV